MRKKTLLLFFFNIYFGCLLAQQVDLGTIANIAKNKPLAFNGGLSASSVCYNGNQQSGRQDWTYSLNGNLNMSIYGQINIPVSINITNQGANYSYPSLPNRLGLHPTYKWVTGHIGDISMNFSSYTLNGHQFTGAGADLTPGKLKISAMGGRLLKDVEYSSNNPSVMPNYKRIGYGIKAQYDAEKCSFGMIYFGAKDIENKYKQFYLDSLGILPMQNTALSWNARMNLVKNMTFSIEYALSLLTRDIRAPKNGGAIIDKIFGMKTSTNTYHALNAKFNYQIKKNSIGIGYERIDPDYKTLGAYYFNNDYENITLNYARPFLKNDKANIALSFGFQRDDLNNQKEEATNRYVGSANLNYAPSEALQTSLNYSTFQSFKNVRSQFDYINQTSPYENMDTLRFAQLSQNLDASVIYTFKKTEKINQRINLNLSYQESADRHGGISLSGEVSRFINSALGYGITLIPQGINVASSVNASYSYSGTIESYTLGPMIGITGSLLKKAITTGLSSSYNININSGEVQARVLNFRWNASYRIKKKHSLNANVVWQNRGIINKKKTDAITSTLAYSYSF
jgi:hypothetical protein